MLEFASMLAWLNAPLAGTATWAWLLFIAIVAGLLALDLGVFHREDREIGLRESLWTSALYVAAALAFGGWVGAVGDSAASPAPGALLGHSRRARHARAADRLRHRPCS